MRIIKRVRHKLLGAAFGLCLLCLFAYPVSSMQDESAPEANQNSPYLSATVNGQRHGSAASSVAAPARTKSSNSADRVSMKTIGEIGADKITSFFVRTNDSKRIQLSMLVAYKAEFTRAVRELTGLKVTPLLFSITTLPGRTVDFDPSRLCFEQRGRAWQPSAKSASVEIITLHEGERFGGTLTDGQVQQAVILLPEWFDPNIPITFRYGDFHYLARFAEMKPTK
jgi:hypothetical protein